MNEQPHMTFYVKGLGADPVAGPFTLFSFQKMPDLGPPDHQDESDVYHALAGAPDYAVRVRTAVSTWYCSAARVVALNNMSTCKEKLLRETIDNLLIDYDRDGFFWVVKMTQVLSRERVRRNEIDV